MLRYGGGEGRGGEGREMKGGNGECMIRETEDYFGIHWNLSIMVTV